MRNEIIQHWSDELVGRNFSIRLPNDAKSSDFTDISQVTQATVLNIKLIQKGFSEFKESEAIKMAKLEVNTIADIKRMKLPEFVVLFLSTEKLQSEETLIVCKELQRRMEYFNLAKSSEYTMREFITPILLGALELYGKFNKLDNTDLQLVCEKRVTGLVGNGPVDYIVTYKTMNIILTEAKKEKLDSGVLQNICQQVASVQEIARLLTLTTSKKRKYEEILADIEMMPSYGIVSTGEDWIFMRYCAGAENGSPRLLISERIQYCLQNVQMEENLDPTCNLIRIIAGIVKAQVDNMNDWEPKFKQIREENSSSNPETKSSPSLQIMDHVHDHGELRENS